MEVGERACRFRESRGFERDGEIVVLDLMLDVWKLRFRVGYDPIIPWGAFSLFY